MNNVFLQIRNTFTFKPEPLKKLVAAQPNKQINQMIENFFKQKHENIIEYANLIRNILVHVTGKQAIEKLLHLLVYFSTLIEADQIQKILESLKATQIPSYVLVKFYSFIFKSVQSQKLKKWLIISSLEKMENEQKTSPFASFVQNFQLIVGTLHLDSTELIEVYWKLINYLEKHLLYKRLASHYVFVALNLVNNKNVNMDIVSKMIIKAINSDNFKDDSIDVLNSQALKTHQLFSILEARMTGDINAIEKVNNWEKYQLEKQKITRKVKIEAIPRLFKNIKQASYTQAAQMLGIEKKEVQGYIIEAVRLGIMKAKLDEYQQTILINKLILRCLQKDEQVQLQKEITDLCEKLDKMA